MMLVKFSNRNLQNSFFKSIITPQNSMSKYFYYLLSSTCKILKIKHIMTEMFREAGRDENLKTEMDGVHV